ncbi:hypothetical protein TKK_0002267 [Trichogramma kaykai]
MSSSVTSCSKCQINFSCVRALACHQLLFHCIPCMQCLNVFESDYEVESHVCLDPSLTETSHQNVGEQVLTTKSNPCEGSQNEIDDFDWTTFNGVPSAKVDCKFESHMDLDPPIIGHQDAQEDLGEQVLGTTLDLCKESRTETNDFHRTSFIEVPSTEVCCDQEQNEHHETVPKKFRKERKHHKYNVRQKTFTQQSDLKTHVKTVHDKQRDYECNVCQKIFTQQNSLIRHQESVHEGRRDYECDVCQKTFSLKSNLKRHVKEVHDKQKDHTCDLCQKSFTQKASLKKHIKGVHDKQKDYECDVCQKTFTQQNSLIRHQKSVHEGRRNYECNVCHGLFISIRNLKQHKKEIHEGRKDFQCKLCQKTFSRKNSLKQHIKTMHNIQMA